jgi:hypothetical protein
MGKLDQCDYHYLYFTNARIMLPSLFNRYNTIVGERGLKMSGGGESLNELDILLWLQHHRALS